MVDGSVARRSELMQEPAGPGLMEGLGGGGDLDPLELARQVWGMIQARRWLFIATVVLVTAGGIALPHILPPSFTATATLIVEPTTPRLSGVAEDGSIGSWNDYLKSQILVIKSRSVTRRAFELVADSAAESAPGEDPIARFQESVIARSVNGSRLICISVTARDPDDAARRANAVVDAYIAHCLETRRSSSLQAFSWLTEQISSVKKKIERSDRDLLELDRQGANFSIETQQVLLENRIESLDRHLTKATVERNEIEAILEEVDRLPTDTLLFRALPSDALTQTASKLATELAGYEQELSERLLELKSQHPRVVKLNAAIEIRRDGLSREARQIIKGLEAQHRVICANQTKIRADLEELKKASMHLAELRIRHGVLEREAQSNREMYELLLSRLAQSDIGGQVTVANISVVDRAHAPTSSDTGSSPRKALIALMLGVCLGTGLCYSVERLGLAGQGSREPETHPGPSSAAHGPSPGNAQPRPGQAGPEPGSDPPAESRSS